MKIEAQIIDMLSGELSPQEEQVVMAQIENDAEALKLYNQYKEIEKAHKKEKKNLNKPTSKLRSNVLDIIEKEKNANTSKTNNNGKIIRLPLLQKIASIAAVFVVGLFIWQQVGNQTYRNEVDQEIAMLKSEIDKHIASSSVSTRIKAVNYSRELPTEDQSILELIIEIAENDENANVRLAAVQSLSNHLSAPMVPGAFKRMLINEEDAAVKIAIIETVSKIKSDDIVRSLEDLTERTDIPQYVKDEAHNSMNILQHGEEF